MSTTFTTLKYLFIIFIVIIAWYYADVGFSMSASGFFLMQFILHISNM